MTRNKLLSYDCKIKSFRTNKKMKNALVKYNTPKEKKNESLNAK